MIDRNYLAKNGNHKQVESVGSIREATRNMDFIRIEKSTIQQNLKSRAPEMEDLEAVVGLVNTSARHMIGEDDMSLAELRTDWQMPQFDKANSARLVVSPNGQAVGYAEVWDIDDPPVKIWSWGRVHPEYEGCGIGTYLLNWAEDRARKALSRVPDGARVVLEIGSYGNYEPGLQLLQDHGMQPIRKFLTMAIELHGPPETPVWPSGIKVRTMRGEEELGAVVRAMRDSFQDHWGYVEQPFEHELEHWRYYVQNDERFDRRLWYLAMDGNEIAGIELCWPESNGNPDMGWVGVLGIRRPWRRRGIGLALLRHSFGHFYRTGKTSVGLGVDAGSLTKATRLYETAGMRPIRQFSLYEKELRTGRDLSLQTLRKQ